MLKEICVDRQSELASAEVAQKPTDRVRKRSVDDRDRDEYDGGIGDDEKEGPDGHVRLRDLQESPATRQ